MTQLQSMIVAMSLYSKIPMPHIEWNEKNMKYALCYFPVIGIAIGVLVWLWSKVSVLTGVGTIFTTVIYMLIPILITGGIHLDGLLDTADALSSWQTKERRLEILKDSHAGAFAIIVCCGYFLAMFGIWSEVDAASIPILALGFLMSRALNGFGIVTFPCAKGSGLVASFSNGAEKRRCRIVLIIWAIVIAAAMIAVDWKRGIIAVATALITCAVVRRIAMKQFGGITGDLQGFFLQSCELAMAFTVILIGRIW